jgi:outer membrane lipoprotein-sorting protein
MNIASLIRACVAFLPFVLAAQTPSGFDIALIGDMPYGAAAEPRFERVIADINQYNLEFTAHIGDTKSGSTRCDDSHYTKTLAYFNSFKTLKGEFVQTSPKGRTDRGVLFISKPGKLRFDYAPPSPLLIVSDGRWLTIKNKVKERGDQVPLRSTPLRLIVAPKIDLLAETVVLSVEEADGFTSVALADKKDQLGGYIVLIYDNSQNTLQQWIIVDGKGRKTTVQFANLEKDVQLNQKLFMETIKRKDQVRN